MAGAVEDGGELRATDSGHHAGGAHGARADADLDDVGTRLHQRADALGGDHVAGGDRDLRVERPHRLQRLHHPVLVAVRGVHDQDVDA